MKVIISDSRNSNLLAPQLIFNLKNKGVDVISFFQSDYYEDLGFLERVFHKLYPEFYYGKVNKILIDLVEHNKPECLLLFKGMEVFPETIELIKSKGVKTINYNPDHPFDFISSGSGNQNVLKSISLFDNYITYSEYIKKELKSKFPELKTSILPFGYMISDYDYMTIKEVEEIKEVAFVGYADNDRFTIIKHIIDAGFSVNVFGDKWNLYNRFKNLIVHKPVFGLEYYKTLRKYRIQLNLLRKHNHDSHNMRTFEVPAVGGIMLTERTSEQLDFFKEDEECFFYANREELISKIRFILSMSKEEADVVREAARNRSVKSNYDYANRASQLIKIIKETIN